MDPRFWSGDLRACIFVYNSQLYFALKPPFRHFCWNLHGLGKVIVRWRQSLWLQVGLNKRCPGPRRKQIAGIFWRVGGFSAWRPRGRPAPVSLDQGSISDDETTTRTATTITARRMGGSVLFSYGSSPSKTIWIWAWAHTWIAVRHPVRSQPVMINIVAFSILCKQPYNTKCNASWNSIDILASHTHKRGSQKREFTATCSVLVLVSASDFCTRSKSLQLSSLCVNIDLGE